MLTGDALGEAIERLNDIVAAIGAHQRRGRYDAEQLLEQLEADARDVRKLLEAVADQTS